MIAHSSYVYSEKSGSRLSDLFRQQPAVNAGTPITWGS
jgi:hypothetical protein